MLPTTSHTISNLTENVPISAQEAGVWTKLMKKTIEAKIKMTKFTMTVLTLKKLYSKSLGTDCVEKFLKKECNEKDGKERIKIVRRIMMTKIKDAERNEGGAKREYRRLQDYLERRWGQNTIILAQMKELMQEEVRRIWKAGRDKLRKKVDFLERKWRRKRQDLRLNEKEWRGIRYGDRYLRRKQMDEGRDLNDVPLVHGDAQVTEGQKAILALIH